MRKGQKERSVRKGIVAVFALMLGLFGAGACGSESRPEITHELISVTLDPASHLLQGESILQLDSRGSESISFILHPTAAVGYVEVAGEKAPAAFANGILTVKLPPKFREQSLRIRIGYSARFNDPLPDRSASTEDPSYGVEGVIAPQGVFLGGGVAWYPQGPGLPAKRRIEVTLPAGMEGVTAGRRLERGTKGEKSFSVWEEAHPSSQLSLSAGSYVVSESKVGDIPLYAYFSPGNASLAAAYLDASAEYLTLYQRLFGPYPFEKFAIVENFIPTGYGFPSYTLLGGAVLRLPFIIGTSLPHEIAHNWWGNGILPDYRQGNWSEGLVTYLADYMMEEKKSPAAGRDYRFRILTEYASLVSAANEFPLKEFISRTDPASRAIGYGKGAMVFHMVRRKIGEKAFFAALQTMCREKMYQTASWSDFTRAFSKAAGQELGPFMEQWLNRTGGPQVSLADVERLNKGDTWEISGRIVQLPPYWTVPVSLGVATSKSEDFRRAITSKGASVSFAFSLMAQPSRLELDPDVDLFRILSREEIPPAINRIKGARDLLVITGKECRAGKETLVFLLESLGQKGAKMLTEDEVKGPELAGHDLLTCGVSAGKGLTATIPEGVTLSRQAFSIDHQTFKSPEDALFIVGRNPFDPDHVAAFFFPLSAAAADACVTKISHYGKYGYLAFSGGENRKKGILPSGGGGTIVHF